MNPFHKIHAALLFAALVAAVAPPAVHATTLGRQDPAGYTSRIDGPGTEEIFDSATDAQGNVYVVGRFSSTQATVGVFRDLPERLVGGTDADAARFGQVQSETFANNSNANTDDLFVIKYNREGRVVWKRTAGDTTTETDRGHDTVTGVAVDAKGNVFVTGALTAQRPSRFGSIVLTPRTFSGPYPGQNLFVAMLDADGNWQWAKFLDFTVYASGPNNDANIGTLPATFYFRLQSDTFVRNSNDVYGRTPLRTAGRKEGDALALGPDGSVYIKGIVQMANFANTDFNANHIYWLKAPNEGKFPLGYLRRGASGNAANNIYFPGTSFVAKLAATPPPPGAATGTASTYAWDWISPVTSNVTTDVNGNVTFLQSTGVESFSDTSGTGSFGPSVSTVGAMVVDDNSVYLTGTWQGRNVISGSVHTPLTQQDGYVARLRTSNGTAIYAAAFAGDQSTTSAYPGAVAVDDQRNVYMTGAVGNNASANISILRARSLSGGASLSQPFAVPIGSQNFFVGKLNAGGEWQWAVAPTIINPGGPVYAWATSLARDSAGALYLGGGVTDRDSNFGEAGLHGLNFGSGLTVTAPLHGIQGANGAFLAKLTDANGTRTWQHVLETNPNLGGGPHPNFDTADLTTGFGGTIYWSVNTFNGVTFAPGRSPVAADNATDTAVGRGAFLFPVLADAPSLSPTFSSFSTVLCGLEVPPPAGAYRDPGTGKPLQPDVVIPGTTTSLMANFHWDTFNNRLLAVVPTTAEVRWRVNSDFASQTRLSAVTLTLWPTPAQGLITHVTGAGQSGDEPRVSLEPAGVTHTFSSILYTESGAATSGAKILSARGEGYSVLLYTVGANTAAGSAPAALSVVRTRLYTDAVVRSTSPATVGVALDSAAQSHSDPEGKSGYVVSRRARIDAAGAAAAYQFSTQKGPIIPVNIEDVTTATPPADADLTDDLNVIWSTLDAKGIGWPSKCVRYTAAWPANPERIVIASQLGNEMDAEGPTTYAFNAGGTIFYDYTATDGTRYRGNAGYSTGGAAFTNVVPIADTVDDTLYQYGHAGPDFIFELNVNNGNHLVTLHFAEPSAGPSGQRTMNVAFEGATVISNLNVLTRTGGNNRALAVQVPATVTDGRLTIRFTAVPGANQALINAIKVTPAQAQPVLNPATFTNPTVYHQPDRTLAGYNPNEEHALLAAPNLPEGTSAGGRLAAFALRSDLNNLVGLSPTSAPYTLVRYQDAADGLKTKFKVYRVLATDSRYSFASFNSLAGTRVLPPYPLSLLPEGAGTSGSGVPYFKDRKNQVWAKSDGALTARYFYGLQPNFWYDLNGDNLPDAGVAEAPWLDRIAGGTIGTPIAVNYSCTWPPNVPVLPVGDTVTTPRAGLPGVENWNSATVIYEQSNAGVALTANNSAVRILDYTERRVVGITSTPAPVVDGQALVIGSLTFPVERDLATGFYRFTNLPFHLKSRLLFAPQGYVNPTTQIAGPGLILGGYKDATSYAGRPLLLLNILSLQERTRLLALDGQADSVETPWDVAVKALYRLARNPNGVDNDGTAGPDDAYHAGFAKTGSGPLRHADALGPKALTAGKAAGGLGYVTLVENNAPGLGAASVALHIIKVENPPVTGDLKVIFSDNPLDEKITVRHGADFGGDPSALTFQWFYQVATSSTPPPLPDANNPTASNGWIALTDGVGVNDHTFEGASLTTLADSWVYCRYKGYSANGHNANLYGAFAGDPSGGSVSRPVFVPGWIKRVLSGLNPFEARVKNFASAPTQTYSSALVSAGGRYEGDVALSSDPDNLNSFGLISLYETVLRRGLSLSLNGSGQTNAAVNQSLLLAATRISDLYMLLANEAYADAQDPTIGFTTASGEIGSLAPSVFAFANQVPALMQEELALLRGRDNSSAGVGASPVYNRLFWNFTAGLEGEPVYVQNYGVTDQNFDGFINQVDARTLFPQGHGDAWGHYLSALKGHYRLLRHPLYSWNPNTENTLIAGVAVEVDYLDERKFAAAAAARAAAGAEIVNLTYRDSYTADPAGQWQGYRDADRARAWGTDDWARRAGQGAYLDWVTATAILPAVHTNLLHNPILLPPGDDPRELDPTDPPVTGINPTEPPPTGLQKIDRNTVADLTRIAAAFAKIQAQMDGADQGLNPLGVTPGTIPFDIDPTFNEVSSGIQGTTHFEQVFGRTMSAVNNARGIFDYANELTNRLRQTQLSADGFAQDVLEQERDFNARLIEIFGYPYAGDIGSGKTYPTGYNGPDLYHYNYVAVNTVSGTAVVPDTQFSGFFIPFGQEFKAPASGATNANSFTEVYSHYFPNDNTTVSPVNAGTVLTVQFPIATAASWSFAAPTSWGVRRAPGTLQLAISDMVRAEAELRRGLVDYNNHVANIQDQVDLLVARSGLQAENIRVLNKNKDTIVGLNAAIGISRAIATATGVGADLFSDVSEATSEAIPKSVGLATDAFAPVRGVIKLAGALGFNGLKVAGGVSSIAADAFELSKEQVGLATDIEIQKNDYAFEIQEQLKVIEALLREDIGLRIDLFNLQNSLRDSHGQYQIILAEADRLLEDRLVYRKKVAGVTQQNRYQDITFRVFRNDALQKYRAAFDLAARYTYLAATTYDYETVQLGTSAAAGRRFLTDIVKERSLGQFNGNGDPVVGINGLSDPLARMKQNFEVLESRLGLNNPQYEGGQFSLRDELFRILPGDPTAWQDQLQTLRVADLWAVPEFRRFCRPFAPESAGAQPGLVIPFSASVNFGLNFFGLPLGGGDSSYDSTQYVTKIKSVGVSFSGYNGTGLSNTPRVYLVPTGLDVMRAPNDAELSTREFDVVDQAIPVPFPVGTSALQNPNYIPSNDSLDSPFNQIRQFSRFRAYHDSGEDPAQLAGDTRLIGRSVWNTKWMLIIPGGTLLNNSTEGLDTFVLGQPVPGSTNGARDGAGIEDIKLFFETYSYSGN